MKKFTAFMLTVAMTFGMTVSAAATDTIVIENNATEDKVQEAEPTPTPTPEIGSVVIVESGASSDNTVTVVPSP